MVQLARKATAGGATRRNATVLEWDVAGNCETPLFTECWSRPASDDPKRAEREFNKAMAEFIVKAAKRVARGGPWQYSWERLPKRKAQSKYISVGRQHGPGILVVEMWVRCRQCTTCRKVRSRMWYARALAEVARSNRTWFGTITLNPDANHQSLARARFECTRRGHIWEEMTPLEQFTQLHKQNGVHLQLWLKRVRKESGANIRYLLVCEAHKSGLPHYHCLIHEMDDAAPVRHAVLSKQWKLGFTNFKLVVDAKQAGYLCKYLSKSVLARVRASTRYGNTSSDIVETCKRENERSEVFIHDTPDENERSGVVSKTTKLRPGPNGTGLSLIPAGLNKRSE